MNSMLQIGPKLLFKSPLAGAALALAIAGSAVPAARAQDAQNRTNEQAASRPHAYRLTFTFTRSDAGKRMSVQHYATTIVAEGNGCQEQPVPCHAIIKMGSKEPVMTGGVAKEGGGPGASQYQFTYIDVGLNLDARLNEVAGGLELAVKAESSRMATDVNPQELKDPVVLQTVVQTATMIKPGVPVAIGSLDSPDTTQHVDIEVKLEPVS